MVNKLKKLWREIKNIAKEEKVFHFLDQFWQEMEEKSFDYNILSHYSYEEKAKSKYRTTSIDAPKNPLKC
jgi:hypothetical protein